MLNAQAVGRPGNQRIEYAVAGKPKNVVDIVVFGPFHHFVTAIVTITPPDDARLRPVLAYPARDMLDDRPHLRALGCLGGPQDRHHRRAAPHMIDMHGGKAALVLVCIPERKLLTTMCRAECVVDVEDLLFPRLYPAAELIDKGSRQPRSLRLARRIL